MRDVYFQGFLDIGPGMLAVDLGANAGVFTALAAARGARVVAVEPNADLLPKLQRQVEVNGFGDRVEVVRAFVGGRTTLSEQIKDWPEYRGAEFLSVEELLARLPAPRIDFLKCDIEGSEFGLLTDGSPLLAATRQIAIEIHKAAGDPDALLRMIERAGFTVGGVRDDPEGCIAVARRVV